MEQLNKIQTNKRQKKPNTKQLNTDKETVHLKNTDPYIYTSRPSSSYTPGA